MTDEPLKRSEEAFLRDLHAASTITFGTMMPFQLGHIAVQRIGFADIPVVSVRAIAPSPDGMTAIIRQHVYAELAAASISNAVIQFTPGVSVGRRRRFVDCNASSATLGKNKMGYDQEWRFEILREHVQCFAWDYHYAHIPRRRSTQSVLDFMLAGGEPKGRWVYLPDSREGFPHIARVANVLCGTVALAGVPERYTTAELMLESEEERPDRNK